MKTRLIEPELLLQTWQSGVKVVLFPDALIKELSPDKTLNKLGDDLIRVREQKRKEVDGLIDRLIELDTPQMLHQALRETDRTLVSLYFDRIQAASASLGRAADKKERIEVPDSWFSLVSFLLHQKLFQ